MQNAEGPPDDGWPFFAAVRVIGVDGYLTVVEPLVGRFHYSAGTLLHWPSRLSVAMFLGDEVVVDAWVRPQWMAPDLVERGYRWVALNVTSE